MCMCIHVQVEVSKGQYLDVRLQRCVDALSNNVDAVAQLLGALSDVISGCVYDMNDMTKELGAWHKQWRLEEVRKAPKLVRDI